MNFQLKLSFFLTLLQRSECKVRRLCLFFFFLVIKKKVTKGSGAYIVTEQPQG